MVKNVHGKGFLKCKFRNGKLFPSKMDDYARLRLRYPDLFYVRNFESPTREKNLGKLSILT